MKTIRLGQKGAIVPCLCVGTWAWGDKLFWNYGQNYGAAEVRAAFQASLEAGITFFDTAEVYGPGVSEELLGQFIRESDRPVQVATKYGPLPWRIWGNAVSQALTDSLRRLQLPRVELYQVHWPFTFLMSQSTLMNTLADEVEKGRIGAVGVSNYSAAQMREAHEILAKRGIPLAVNQVRYSLLARQIETDGTLTAARELGITILAYSPLAQGLLTGKYRVEQYQPPTGPRQFDRRFQIEGLTRLAPLLNRLQELGAKYDRTPAQVALNWLIGQDGVIPIAGVKTAEQARQNAGALGWSLTADELQELATISLPLCS